MGNVTKAEPIQRVLARLIDGVIWIPVYFILALIVGAAGTTSDAANVAANVGGIFILLGWAFLYDVVPMALRGQTVGKMVLGLKAIGPNGESPLGWPIAFKRWALTIIAVIPLLGIFIHLIIGLVSLVLLFSDDRSRTLHDMVGGTIVVKA